MGGFIKTCVRIVLVQRQHCTCTFLTADFRDITHSWFYCCWGLRKYAPNSVKNLLILKAIPVFLLCEVTKSDLNWFLFFYYRLCYLYQSDFISERWQGNCVCARVCVCVCEALKFDICCFGQPTADCNFLKKLSDALAVFKGSWQSNPDKK